LRKIPEINRSNIDARAGVRGRVALAFDSTPILPRKSSIKFTSRRRWTWGVVITIVVLLIAARTWVSGATRTPWLLPPLDFLLILLGNASAFCPIVVHIAGAAIVVRMIIEFFSDVPFDMRHELFVRPKWYNPLTEGTDVTKRVVNLLDNQSASECTPGLFNSVDLWVFFLQVRCGNIMFFIRHVVAEGAYEDLGRIMGARDVAHHPILILNL
jgi:hypothetical protein